MQKLHPVGFTTELDGLVLSARKGAKTGRFVVQLDGKLLQQLAEAERRRDGSPRADQHRLASPRLVRPESALTPREMQDRIRAGWSVDEVAAEAGVDLDWVRRFASPVLAEVGRVVERAQAIVFDKPRVGTSALPLGASVRRNVAERGVRLLDENLDDSWSAYQLDEDVWVVRFVYTSRGRAQEAEWLFDIGTEDLSSRNRLAGQLGYVARGRSKKAAPPPTPAPRRSPPPARLAKPKAAKAKPKAAPAKAAAMPIVALPASTSGTGRTRRAPRKKAAARPAKRPAKKRARPALPAVRPSSEAVAPPAPPAPTPPSPPSRPSPAPPARPAPPAPPPRPRQQWPSATREPPARGPLGRPAPVPVPPSVREAVATPIGDEAEPPRPGAVEIDRDAGIARIDSRRLSHYVSTPPRRPRRSEPLRGR